MSDVSEIINELTDDSILKEDFMTMISKPNGYIDHETLSKITEGDKKTVCSVYEKFKMEYSGRYSDLIKFGGDFAEELCFSENFLVFCDDVLVMERVTKESINSCEDMIIFDLEDGEFFVLVKTVDRDKS